MSSVPQDQTQPNAPLGSMTNNNDVPSSVAASSRTTAAGSSSSAWLQDAQTVSRQVQRLQRSSSDRNSQRAEGEGGGGGGGSRRRPQQQQHIGNNNIQGGRVPPTMPSTRLAKIVPTVLRVFQLDGLALEMEATKLIRSTITQALSASVGSTAVYNYEEELDLLLNLTLFKFGLWDQNQHYGDKLQNVVYRSEAKANSLGLGNILLSHADTRPTATQKLLKLLLALLLPYLVRKLTKKAADEEWTQMAESTWQHKVAFFLTWYDHLETGGELINTLVFFRHGTYRSLVDRALGLRLVHGRQRMTRVVNLVFLTQQIYYNTVFQVLSYFLPLFNLGKAWRMLSGLRFAGGASRSRSSAGVDSSSSPVGSPTSLLGGSMLESRCPLCSTEPMSLPRKTSCRHPICYYCAASRTVQGAKFNCPTCGNSLGEADISVLPPVVVVA